MLSIQDITHHIGVGGDLKARNHIYRHFALQRERVAFDLYNSLRRPANIIGVGKVASASCV